MAKKTLRLLLHNLERDKFLTKAIGEEWHLCDPHAFGCNQCEKHIPMSTDYSTPDGFFKLWNWAQKQEWWIDFKFEWLLPFDEINIDPDRFANAIYEFLKGK